MQRIRWSGVLVVAVASVVVSSCTHPPAPSPPLTGAAQVTSGNQTSCALISGGTVKCWGDNFEGQLGSAIYAADGYIAVPVNVTGLTNAVQVVSGDTHTCAVVSSGGVKCWGDNGLGQLGDGTTVDRDTAVDVVGISDAVQVAAVQYLTCALRVGGSVKCWGNGYGSSPVDVPGLAGVTQITAGCALVVGGAVKCWGDNLWGNLGDGTTTPSSTPVEVLGVTGAVQIAGEQASNCALAAAGTVKCWGFGRQGQMGNGTNADVNSVAVDVSGLAGATQIDASGGHNCALTSGGAVECWGGNHAGQLGDQTLTDRNVPVDVIGVTGAIEVDTGGSGTCLRFVGGTIQCWGQNGRGELGNGSLSPSLVPVSVVAGL